jgi:glycerol-3-phosphate dehydrogenase
VGLSTEHRIVYSKGIHLDRPAAHHNERVLAFFDDTQRLFYVIPMGRRSVIGTTDTRVDDPYTEVTDDDVEFLLGQINDRLDLDTPLTAPTSSPIAPAFDRWSSKSGGGDQRDVDWTKLSRKHEIETDHRAGSSSVFGGKLTDCLNVGEEVADEIEALGVPLEKDLHNWYGEPAAATREEFYRQARLMKLDDVPHKPDTEPLSDRLWRRYGRRAFAMLEEIRADPAMAEDVMGSADYLRVELHVAAGTEMVTKLEDFMRRRSKIDLVVRDDDIAATRGAARSPRSCSATTPTGASPSTSAAPTSPAGGAQPGCDLIGTIRRALLARHVGCTPRGTGSRAPTFDPAWRDDPRGLRPLAAARRRRTRADGARWSHGSSTGTRWEGRERVRARPTTSAC